MTRFSPGLFGTPAARAGLGAHSSCEIPSQETALISFQTSDSHLILETTSDHLKPPSVCYLGKAALGRNINGLKLIFLLTRIAFVVEGCYIIGFELINGETIVRTCQSI